jgi:uncharacterized cysteine cluster protein YcgN (CxxCxxCC family)
MIPCKRCGLCCIIELCSKGRRKDKTKKGNCKYLIHNNDGTTSCKLILENKMKNSAIEFEQGCVFQEDYPHLYEFYSETILANNQIKS